MCDSLSRAECVPAFTHESERGAFVPEVLKIVWTMCWKRWYDCVSCAFHGFFEDEKESRIKGWRLNRRRSRHFCPQCGQLTGVQRRRLWRLLCELLERLASWFPQTQMSQGFWWCLVAVSEGNRGNHLRVINGAGQACFESPQSMKRNFRPFKNRTAVTKEERLRQRKNCAAIDKDRASPSNDNFLITVPPLDSFPLLVTVLFVSKGG